MFAIAVIGLAFVTQWKLKQFQNEFIKNHSDSSNWMNSLAIQMVYLGTALTINAINYLIGMAVRIASQREKHLN